MLKLIWETGEIDPVARNLGNPGRVGEGRRIAEVESEDESESNDADRHAVKWVRREVELVDSTRPLGYWIEGRVALIRVELVQDM